jgi:hypothetical protein
MSIDELGRTAAADARRKATQEVDPKMMLQQLHRTHRNRNLVAVGVAVAAVAVGATLLVRSDVLSADNQQPGVHAPSPAPFCPDGATCLGGNRYRVALPVPVTISLPSNFRNQEFNNIGTQAVENYRNDVNAGVTVMERVEPVKPDDSITRDPSGGSTAHAMAVWLSHRPFVVGARVTSTTVDGMPGWTVSATMRPGTRATAQIGAERGVPTFADNASRSWFGPNLTSADYTLLDLPGGGVALIWSWTLDHNPAALAGNAGYVQGLSFG